MEANLESLRACTHCGNPIPRVSTSQFCCLGCDTVYHWIQDHELQKYYDLKGSSRPIRKPHVTSDTLDTYRYLDDPEFLKLYSWQTSEGRWMEFYVEGVHCTACVWLTEKITEIIDDVNYIRLNLGNSIATVRINKSGAFSSVALALQNMGYRPHPVKQGESAELQNQENRRFLVRIGVAGACAGNIMLLAVSLYSGVSGTLAELFHWMTFGLFLPVLFFCAIPFYKSTWYALKSKQISIDIPVVFGILLGAFVSTVNLFLGDDRVYFDSLSALVFLLLSTRYVLKRTQQFALDSSHLLQFLTPAGVHRWNALLQRYEEVSLNQVSVGDRIQVLPSESVPVDGIVLKGSSSLNCALLSGESEPQKVAPQEMIFAGTVNLGSPLEVQVTQSGSKTRIGRILESTETLLTKKAPITQFADRVSRYFVVAVMILSGIVFFWSIPGDWHEGLNRALAIVIVTCPCTFALITPLALSITLGKLARAGILVKGPDVLERLSQVKSVFLDKTGTLTFGTPQVTLWNVPKDLSSQIFAIESCSTHPVAKAIVNYLLPQITKPIPPVQEINETLGIGIRGLVEGDWIELKRADTSTEGTEISIYKNSIWVGRAVLMDQIRPDAKKAVELLKSLNLTPWILSGDHRTAVTQVAQLVGIDFKNCHFETSPEEKSRIIQDHSPTLMVGDGANDAMALARAFVSISVHGGVEISLRAADIYIRIPGVQPIFELILISRETLRVVRRNLAFSIFYNLIAGGFALMGKVNPLFAAILMPVSAFTVFLSSSIGTSALRKALKRLE